MAWNIMALLSHGESTGPLYPVTTKRGIGFELEPGEGVIDKYDFTTMTLDRAVNSQWGTVYSSRGNKGELIVTDRRAVIVFDGVPKNRSFFTPIALGQAVAGMGRNRGQSFAGHLRYEWVDSVAARPQSIGLSNQTPTIRMTATDGTDGGRTPVRIEIPRSKAPKIATQLARALVTYRLGHSAGPTDDSLRERWTALAAAEFNPPAKEFEVKDFSPAVSAQSHQ